MASVQRAAEKSVKDRKAVDNLRIKAGHMLTFDHLVLQPDIVERQAARKVVRKSVIRSAGCLSLPLTFFYFIIYVIAARLHEDVTGVYFMESTARMRTDKIFTNVRNIEELWEALLSPDPGGFIDVFFRQTDAYGLPLARNTSAEQIGDFGLVESYNAIQGAVRFFQFRETLEDCGAPYTCSSTITCELCRTNEGLQNFGKFTTRRPLPQPCGNWTGRRLTEDLQGELGYIEEIPLSVSEEARAAERRLVFSRPELREQYSKMKFSIEPDEGFQFWLFPSETQEQVLERLTYFRDRRWMDKDTAKVEIRMYLLNAELGRSRVEELKLNFHIAASGSVYYDRRLETLFLEFWSGGLSKLADAGFFVVLLFTTCYRFWLMWKAFVISRLFLHFFSLSTLWEWLIVLVGWWNIFGFYKMLLGGNAVVKAMLPVHRKGWEINQSDVDELVDFFAVCDRVAKECSTIRLVFMYYSIVLMFRLFVSFGSQPRLAVVLRTMKNVGTDFYHFLIVFTPTFFAYLISGSLMFGRKMESFATVMASFGTIFRMAMESEYDWDALSVEFFWAAAVWSWSFMILVVLLFMNMVLAIILDVYNETRLASFPGEAIWETMGQMMTRMRLFKTWVPDRKMDGHLTANSSEMGMLTRKDLDVEFPDMPEKQKEYFFKACRVEMQWESAKDLQTKNLMKLTGSVVDALDVATKVMDRVNVEEREDPLASWVHPAGLDAEDHKHHDTFNFLFKPLGTKGRKHPNVIAKRAEFDMGKVENGPEWLKETWTLLDDQRKWIEYANWHLEQMQWQVQHAMESRKYGDSNAAAPVL